MAIFKPGNIVLDRDGNAKLVDFGLTGMARHKDGSLVGTPNYIAPS
jgi:serine/threonine protein kinase